LSENKKYYYLKFKDNYFDQDHIKVIEAMANGYEYSLIILKLYLKSLKFDGELRINERIPYDKTKIDILAGVLGHDPANVMHAINIAKELGVMEIFNTGEMFMIDIQEFIGHSSTEGDRKRLYRKKLTDHGTKLDKRADIRPLEIEIELEKEIEKEIKKTHSFKKPTIKEISDYCEERGNNINPESFFDYYEARGWYLGKTKMKDWKSAVRTWEQRNTRKPPEEKMNLYKPMFTELIDREYAEMETKKQEREKCDTN